MVTSATYKHEPIFRGKARLEVLQKSLLSTLVRDGFEALAWAVFPNHYHVVMSNSKGERSISRTIQSVHKFTARQVNDLDQTSGRQVWHNYFDKQLTFERSFMVRLHYVHYNPVRHGLVSDAAKYPFCSAFWFEREAPKSYVETVRSFKDDSIAEKDEYVVEPDIWM